MPDPRLTDSQALTEAMVILRDLMDPEPCRLDHHGYCQEHNWMDESPCPQARARQFWGVTQEDFR